MPHRHRHRSVYSKGDKDREQEKKEKKEAAPPDLLKEASKALDGLGKSISGLFGSKEKKWEKKGTGHTLGSSSAEAQPPVRAAPPRTAQTHLAIANLPAPPTRIMLR